MSITQVPLNKIIYDTILDVLNDNERDVIFSGNYMFRFWQQHSNVHDFEIVKREENELDIKTQRVIPLVDIQTIEVPYVEANRRSDFEREFYLAFKIDSKTNEANQRIIEFDYEDEHYQALLDGIEALRDAPIINHEHGFKFVFKVKQPVSVNVFKYNGDYYQLLSLTINMISLEKGTFTNNFSVYMREKNTGASFEKLDITDGDISSAKNMEAFTVLSHDLEQKNKFRNRSSIANFTINYDENDICEALQDEADGLKDVKTIYEIKVVRSDGTEYIRDVGVTSATYNLRLNTVHRITFRLERV